jgi:hypothetical protein
MFDCEHRRTHLIKYGRGQGDIEHVSICLDCGEINVSAVKEGVRFNTRFHLWSSLSLIAASQATRKSNLSPEEKRKRVWKPLDFAHLRLYEVVLSWQAKGGKRGRERYIVAADSPNQTPQSAANQIRKIYAESYDSNPEMSYWHVQGYPLQVLQPLEWTENGITLFNQELISAVRRYLSIDPAEQVEEWQAAMRLIEELVSEQTEEAKV